MSRSDWTDDELDAALGQLGLPSGAAPHTSAADIAARAAALSAPPRGLTGWRLAAVVAGVGFVGFSGGIAVRDLLDREPERPQTVAVAPIIEEAPIVEDGPGARDAADEARDHEVHEVQNSLNPAASAEPAEGEAAGTAPPSSTAPRDRAAPRAATAPPAERPTPAQATTAPTTPAPATPPEPQPDEPPPDEPQPDEHQRHTDGDDTDGDDTDGPPLLADAPDAPDASGVGLDAELLSEEDGLALLDDALDLDGELDLDEDLGLERVERHRSPSHHHLDLDLGAQTLAARGKPEDLPTSGLYTSATWTRRLGSVTGRAAFTGVSLDANLLAGQQSYRLGGAATALGGVSWEEGHRRLDLGWGLTGRLWGTARALGREGELRGPPAEPEGGPQLLTGPAISASIGDASERRLHFGGTAQMPVFSAAGGQRPVWLGLTAGVDVPLRRREG